MTGPIPATVSSLPKLKVLDLSNQALDGDLPSFASSPELRQVYLQHNDLSNVIPVDFLAAVTDGRVDVDLRFNKLSGIVPGNLSRFTEAGFYAADNELTGLSTDLCSLSWNDGPLEGSTGDDCDHILCGTAEYNGLGRATADLPCDSCPDDSITNSSNSFVGRTYCKAGEREILRELYASLGGQAWKHHRGWEDAEMDICEWHGVKCHSGDFRSGTVKALHLNGNGLQGTLPERIWSLTELEDLDLSDNELVVESLDLVSTATSLTVLKLSRNNVKSLTGIGAATLLTAFHCTQCGLEGPIPDELFDLVRLENLFLNYNKLSGELPNERISQWEQLKELHLVHNQFNGTIPRMLTTLGFLEVIALGHNRFSGELPPDIEFLPFLRVLAIDHERPEVEPLFGVGDSALYGNLPSFKMNPKLREIYLSYNLIDGEFPPDFLAGVDDKSATVIVDLTSVCSHDSPPPPSPPPPLNCKLSLWPVLTLSRAFSSRTA